MDKLIHDVKFEFLVVETFDMRCYGFNSEHAVQCAIAKKIIQDVNSFIVNGWKVARQIPKWILHYDAWNDFTYEKCSGIKSEENYSKKDTDNKDFEYEEEEEGEDDKKLEQDEEKQENKEEAEEEEEDEEEGEVEEDMEKEEEEEEEEEKLNGPITQDEDYNVVKNQMIEVELKDKLFKHTVDTVKNQMAYGELNNNMSKHAVDTVKSSIEDEDVFKSICGGNLRKKLSKSNTFKSHSIDIHITGPFSNNTTGKSHWVVVYGDMGSHMCLNHILLGNI